MDKDVVPANFPVLVTLPVQWGEQDLYGHVNNVVYFRWFESARVAYGDRLGFARRMSEEKCGPILAQVNCNFRRQLTFPDTVIVGARVVRLGRSSLVIGHGVWREKTGTPIADGESTVVYFDYAKQQSTRIPDELRQRIAEIEGGAVEGARSDI